MPIDPYLFSRMVRLALQSMDDESVNIRPRAVSCFWQRSIDSYARRSLRASIGSVGAKLNERKQEKKTFYFSSQTKSARSTQEKSFSSSMIGFCYRAARTNTKSWRSFSAEHRRLKQFFFRRREHWVSYRNINHFVFHLSITSRC